MDKVRTALASKYACEDADAAYQLAATYEPRLEAAGLRTLYDTLEVPLIGVLAEMERTGIRVDVPFLTTLGADGGGVGRAGDRSSHARRP